MPRRQKPPPELSEYDKEAEEDSRTSLEAYLKHIVIDSRPEPRPWGQCIEEWQRGVIGPMVPAVEKVAGLRPDYTGPRSFFYVLPRGHDKTGMIARLCNWAISFARHPLLAIAAAADLDQARLILQSMKSELSLNPWLKQHLVCKSLEIEGPGGTLQVISADAGSSSGLKADIIVCDELTMWKSRALFDILYSGREKRPDSVFAIITNAGFKQSWQHQLLEKARNNTRHWKVYEAPEGHTLATWMSAEGIESLRESLDRGVARRVLDNIWTDTIDRPLLEWDLIAQCHADCLWPDGRVPEGQHPELYVGIDVGRSKDRTVIWTLERVGDVLWTREIKVMAGSEFEEQETAIYARMTKEVLATRIDKGGIGMQMAERLALRHRAQAEGVQLNPAKQGQLALALKTAFQSRRIRIPNDPDLNADLQLVEEVGCGSNGLPMLKTNRGETGHADRFWAAALALYGVPYEPPRVLYVPRGFQSKAAG